jgi:hypothetical protein
MSAATLPAMLAVDEESVKQTLGVVQTALLR